MKKSKVSAQAKRSAAKPTKAAAKTEAKKMEQPMKTQNPADDQGALHDLFTDLLKDIYWAEKMLVKKLPGVQDAATSDELKTAVGEHLAVTRKQVQKVEQVFVSIGEEPRSKKCEALMGLVKEMEELISETDDDTLTRDVAIIIAAQKVEHYEIASYGGMVAIAKVLGYKEAATILNEIMEEEKAADIGLTTVAEKKKINMMAASE